MDPLQSVLKNEVKEEFSEEREDDFKEWKVSRIKRECDLFSESGEAKDLVGGSLLKTEKMCDSDGFGSSLKRESLENDEGIWKKEAGGKKVRCVRNVKVKSSKERIRKRKKHTCVICHINVFDLKAHLLTHTRQTPYKCTLCNKCFSHRTSLNRHRIYHSGERPYECLHCEKTYIEASQLKLHLNLHSGQKPNKCNLCGKTFANKGALRSHITNAHLEQRDFICDVCKKEFKRKDHLRRHSFIHTGEKQYACASCDKYFTRKCHLQRHLAKHE